MLQPRINMVQPSAETNFVSRKKAQKAQKEAIARMESWLVEQCSYNTVNQTVQTAKTAASVVQTGYDNSSIKLTTN
jgi:hypothetical protein